MAENLKDIATRVFRRINYDPNPTEEAVDTCYGFINDAIQQMALDCPILFFEERCVIQTEPDQVAPTTVLYDDGVTEWTDTVTLVAETLGPVAGSYNPWVFEVNLPYAIDGVLIADYYLDGDPWEGRVRWVDTSDGVDLPTPVRWGGRLIDILDSDGELIGTTRIRTVWYDTYTPSGKFEVNHVIRFSIEDPFPVSAFGEGPFFYRVYTQDYYLPDGIIEIKSARVLGNNKPNRLTFIGQAEAEEAGFVNEQAPDVGIPVYAFRGQTFSLPAPNTAPAVSTALAGNPWLGPEPPGEFEYCYTICFGVRPLVSPGIAYWAHEAIGWREVAPGSDLTLGDPDSAAVLRRRDPLWESPPSPVSDAITVSPPTATPAHSMGAQLTIPNIEYQLGFGLVGRTSVGGLNTVFRRNNVGASGWHIRVYRRRKSADFTRYTELGATISGQSVTYLTKLDIQDSFHLMYEVRFEDVDGFSWVDNGTVLPDYQRRLRPTNGYQAIRLWPRPDDSYSIELRCIRSPEPLLSDQDAPKVQNGAIKLIVDYAAALMLEKLNEPDIAALRRADYQRNLETLTRRAGDIRPNNTPIPKRLARASGYNRGNPWRRPRGSE